MAQPTEAELWKMLDMEVLQQIQDRFAEVTGLGAIIADSQGRAVTRASCFSELCRRVRATPEGERRCFASDAAVGMQAVRTGRPCSHFCHAGLLDTAAPIVVNGTYVGSVLCGQILVEEPDRGKRLSMARRLQEVGLSPEDIEYVLDHVMVMPLERLRAASDLLHVLANYIVNEVVTQQTERRLAEERQARAELERSLREMELRVLHSQVNPHFLFNALNTVARMALFEDAPKTQDLVIRMSRILRRSLSRVDQLVPLEEELGMVEDYLCIQRARFGDRIRSRIEVTAQALKAKLPTFTVQALVENAVVRGLEPLVEGGEVVIRGWVEGSDVVVEIQDTGVGLDPTRGNRYRFEGAGHPTEGHTTGLGIFNVHQRLQHQFGETYGLIYLPVAKGTRVQIRAPLTAEGEEHHADAAHCG